MPEKMTTVTASLAALRVRTRRPRGRRLRRPPKRAPAAARRAGQRAGAPPPYVALGGAGAQREQGVEDLDELRQRRVGDRRPTRGRVQEPGDAAQQVAEQVARALDGVDAQL